MGERPVRLGWMSLLLAVILVCLATLSVLSFTTARAAGALAEKQAAQVTETYALEREGQSWLAQIDALLHSGGVDALQAAAPDGTDWENGRAAADFKGTSGRTLSVAVEISSDGVWRVSAWRFSADWAGEVEPEALLGTN